MDAGPVCFPESSTCFRVGAFAVVEATWGFISYPYEGSENALFNTGVRYDDMGTRTWRRELTWCWAGPRRGCANPGESGSTERRSGSPKSAPGRH